MHLNATYRKAALPWRSWKQSLLVLMFVLASSLWAGQSPVIGAGPDVGYRSFAFSAGGADPVANPNNSPTASKPQSKLWFNDGSWWGSLLNMSTGAYHMYQFDPANQSWLDTGTVIDERSGSHADCLWDGTHLYVATAGTSANPADSGRVLRYSYDTLTKRYTLDANFPVAVTARGVEAIVLAKDSAGKLWVTFTQDRLVFVNRSLSDEATWGTPFTPAVAGTTVDSDDIAAVIAFEAQIGVLWSNQVDDAIYFATHRDGDPDEVWTSNGPALQGLNEADDHLNIKALSADPRGRVFAAIKTSLNDGPDPDAALLRLLVLEQTGSWANYVYGRVSDNHTRPLLLIDEEHGELYLFATAPQTSGSIYYKRASLANIAFEPGLGTPFIQRSSDPAANNATATKQNVNNATGLLVAASDVSTGYYLHNTIDLSAVTPLTLTYRVVLPLVITPGAVP